MKKLIVLLMISGFGLAAHAMDDDIMTHVTWHQYHCSSPKLENGNTFIGVGYSLQCAVTVTNTRPDVAECRFYEQAISPEAVLHPMPLQKTRSAEPDLISFVSTDGRVRVTIYRETLNAGVDFNTGAQMQCLLLTP